jgi:hypothetical protein
VLVEALGYVGGAIALAGSLLVGTQVWSDLGTAWRLAVLGLACCGMVAGGRLAPGNAVGSRLRSVLLGGAVVVGAGFLGVLGTQALELAAEDVALLASGGTAALAAGLWLSHRRPLQQVAMMAATAVAAGVVIDRMTGSPQAGGLGVLVVGVAWAALGGSDRLRPARMARALGCATAILGAMITSEAAAGVWLTLAVVILVLAWAVRLGDLLLLAVAAAGTLLNLPQAIGRWFPGSALAGLVVVGVGAALVVLAVGISRRRA